MRKYLLPSLLVLALAAGFAWAQNITRGVQMSQDPTGPIGSDTSNNLYFGRGSHFLTFGAQPPVLTSCGSGVITGSDTMGVLSPAGVATTTCTLTFTQAYLTAPGCVFAPMGSSTWPTYTTSTTAITVTTLIASVKYAYQCWSVS